MTSLDPGQAKRLDAALGEEVLAAAELVHSEDSGMTGPIHVLALPGRPDRWILEYDTRRRPVLRRMSTGEDPGVFIAGRREAYERLWDG